MWVYLSSYGNSTIVARENSASGSVIARIDSKYNAGWDASVQNVDIQRSFVSNSIFSGWSSVEDDVIYLKNPDDYYAFAARYKDSSGNWLRKVTYQCHKIRTEDEAKVTLDWYGTKQPEKDCRCPRCGEIMWGPKARHALSRYAAITVCDCCGMEEALEKAGVAEMTPLMKWCAVELPAVVGGAWRR